MIIAVHEHESLMLVETKVMIFKKAVQNIYPRLELKAFGQINIFKILHK